jgi:hypothetical protein
MKITSKNRSSQSYRFTVNMVNGQVSPEDQPILDQLKDIVRNYNNEIDCYGYMRNRKQRVKLQGRGPRNHNGRKYTTGLPLSLSTHADVYVYNVT